jgi:hypothetical protein
MKHRLRILNISIIGFACLFASGALIQGSLVAAAQKGGKPSAPARARGTAFDTPAQATEALIKAAESYDVAGLEAILGPDGHDIVVTGEPGRDKEMAQAFATKAREKMSVSINPAAKNRAVLVIGKDDWPVPVPIVKVGSKWFFDPKAGRQELLYRRIGNNELDAIEICRGYVEAQHEFALIKREGRPVNEYAQRIISTEGKQDGLVWRNADGTLGGPISEEIGKAIEQGYTRTDPYHGYYFKILKGQGPAAPLGQMDFVVKGVMIGGFALIATPAQYRVTGVKTFIVSHDGVVYQKDLGPNTLELAKKIERFNPDRTWTPVPEE